MDETFVEKTCWLCIKSYDDLQTISEYAYLLKNLSQIEVFQDNLVPDKICNNCVAFLIMSNIFRTKIVQSQQKWFEYANHKNDYISNIDGYSSKDIELCRICLENIDEILDQNQSAYLLPKSIRESFLKIQEYETHTTIPEKICSKCVEDLKICQEIIETCKKLTEFDEAKPNCSICRNKSLKKKSRKNMRKLTAFVLTIVKIPDENKVNALRNGKYCNDCVEQLQIAKEVRFKSFKTEKVLKLQFEKYLKVYCDLSDKEISMDEEYLEEYSLSEIENEVDLNTKNAEFLEISSESFSLDNTTEEADFFTLQLNTPPTQIYYTCPRCPATYTYEPDLAMHVDVLHNTTKGTLCNECGFNCKNVASLRQHKLRIHYNVLNHICEICGRLFPGKAKYEAHFVTHFDARNVICQLCTSTFKTRKALNLHMRSHTGFKPYVCEVCKKKFSYYSDMKRHTYTHTNERPYNCEICQKGFVKKKLLTNHMHQHENILGKNIKK